MSPAPPPRHVPLVAPRAEHYPVPISIAHWQLRDLLCSTGDGRLVFTLGSTVRSLDLATNGCLLACSLSYAPRCLKALGSTVVCGGVAGKGVLFLGRGLFSVNNEHTITVGKAINNAVLVHPTATTQLQSHLSNNDESLYTVDVGTRGPTVVDSVHLGMPLNHSALSPDGSTLVATGDGSPVHVLHPGTHDRSIIASGCRSGFLVAFSGDGTRFGVCFEDGVAMVYDTRKPLLPQFELRSLRKDDLGAFRCLKWSTAHDLIAVSEHTERVHIVDARLYDTHQLVVLLSGRITASVVADKATPVEAPFSTSVFYEENEYPQTTGFADARDLTGVEWTGASLAVGTKSGVLLWDVNSWERRSFPSFEYE